MNVGVSDIYKPGFEWWAMSVQSVGEHISFHTHSIVFTIGIPSWSLQIHVFTDIGEALQHCVLGEASREFGMPLLKIRFFEMIRYFRKTTLILVYWKNRV